MLCPVCRHDNFEGEDNCENCGADLRTSDIPQPATSFQGSLLGGHLSDLGIEPPQLVDAMTPVADAIRRMHEQELDCLLCDEVGDARPLEALLGRPLAPLDEILAAVVRGA